MIEKTNKLYSILFVCILIIGFCIHFFYLKNTTFMYGSASGRIFMAKRWLRSPFFPISTVWSPLFIHILAGIISIVRMLYQNVSQYGVIIREVGAIRLWNLTFTLFTFVSFYNLIKITFSNRTAIFSILLLIIYPTYIKWATIPLEVTMFLFFSLSAFYFMFKFRKMQYLKDLMFSSICLSFASMFRLEAWIFIPVLGFF